MSTAIQLADNTAFIDQYGRQKRKLRISVTDRCNFKCSYCMPEHPKWAEKHTLLSFEALYQFCQFMVQRGIEQIRITGGEPLMRQGIVHFIAQLQQLKPLGLKRISMTTNGHYLTKYALDLKQAGLDDLNVSLDSLDEAQFQQLTQKHLQPVLAGIAQAQLVGLKVKVNCVLIKHCNDNQIVPLTHWAIKQEIELRFIEFMPLDGDQKWSATDVVTEQDILNELATVFKQIDALEQGNNPARLYRVDHTTIGIISTISHSFCHQCDRLRLTAQGDFYTCLFAQEGLNIKLLLDHLIGDKDATYQDLEQQLTDVIWSKALGFSAIQAQKQQKSGRISMHMMGG
ncbi:GTP 3',8-cyclase MoaA [Acinetobacter boissieri]|uniref:GTP 3',8-cyclase n=1 Tax=Acinetobacter boissieri TaxID=1219383 RepID=A0A1G6IT50_9GAMM|nr:GTP 3',8-cyclase MoaA [Acinetobacter boissieri]SDC09687.1 cyclic pyranopterin phosphate synthase [Acinetobacter boissieri]